MHFHVLTLFPEMIENGMNTSIMGRAIEQKLIQLEAINIRDFSENKHHKVDDYPYGGGAGMVMEPRPVYKACQSVLESIRKRKTEEESTQAASAENHTTRVIYLNPQGVTFSQKLCVELAKEEDLIFLCGHYEGIDERVLEEVVTDHISIGDYVLTGGELPAMVLMDAISRYVPGVLHNDDSTNEETFSSPLLEYPQYTRPESWNGKDVPQVLLSGHHKNIADYRFLVSLKKTIQLRPDLLDELILTRQQNKMLTSQKDQRFPELVGWIRKRVSISPSENKGEYRILLKSE